MRGDSMCVQTWCNLGSLCSSRRDLPAIRRRSTRPRPSTPRRKRRGSGISASLALLDPSDSRSQQTTEINEKLADCYNKLNQAGADQRASDREIKLKEAIDGLKRSISGVKGRVFELCKPSNRKYATAITTVLGRHLDAVVVDTDETALACIQAMREQRSGTATFLPLNSISPTPVNDRLRHFRGARLAIDIVAFDAQLERAMHYVCGSALVCDDMAAAREICFDKGQEVKAVTLDGTVIHRSGQMTGGNTGESGSRKWDEHEVVGLRRLEESLRAQLVELRKNRPRETTDERHMAEVTRLEAELQIARDDLSATKLRLKSVKDEIKHVRKQVKELGDKAEAVRAVLTETRLT